MPSDLGRWRRVAGFGAEGARLALAIGAFEAGHGTYFCIRNGVKFVGPFPQKHKHTPQNSMPHFCLRRKGPEKSIPPPLPRKRGQHVIFEGGWRPLSLNSLWVFLRGFLCSPIGFPIWFFSLWVSHGCCFRCDISGVSPVMSPLDFPSKSPLDVLVG